MKHRQLFEEFVNESSNVFIIKKKDDDEYVSYNDDNTSKFGGYSITHNRNSAAKFSSKTKAMSIIQKYDLELHLMSDFVVEKY